MRECQKPGGWCPLCYSGVKGRRAYPGHLGWRVGTRRGGGRVVKYVTRTPEGPEGSGAAEASRDGLMAEKLPALGEYLTSTAWGPSEPRETSTLLVFTEAGVWKCCLHDRDRALSLWRSGRTFEDLLAALETALEEGGGDWRPSGKRK